METMCAEVHPCDDCDLWRETCLHMNFVFKFDDGMKSDKVIKNISKSQYSGHFLRRAAVSTFNPIISFLGNIQGENWRALEECLVLAGRFSTVHW